MKRSTFFATLTLVTFLMIAGFAANAQSSWSTSKDVNRVDNDAVFANDELAETHLTASSTTYPSVASQKGVSRVSMNASEETKKGNVVSRGTPSFAISKGVALIGTSKRAQKKVDQAPVSTDPLIPIDKKETNKE